MRKSRSINLLLLGGSMLAFGACVCSGCGRNNTPHVRGPYDPAWHDAQGKPIAKEWKTDETGRRVPAQTPYDASGKPIAFDANGNPIAPPGYGNTYSSGSRSHHGGSWWPWIFAGRSSSSSYGPTYRSGPSSGGSTYYGGSKPGTSSKPSSSGGVSRGGFGGGASSSGS